MYPFGRVINSWTAASGVRTAFHNQIRRCATGVSVSFQIDGKQYIAVQSGWGVDAARMQARLNVARTWQFPDVPQGGSVWVFAVD
jgi:hypothetical protein